MQKIKLLNKILIAISVGYIAACGYLYFFQRTILYIPDKTMELPEKYGLSNASVHKIKTSDNVTITTWYIKPKGDMPILLYFHGNRGNLGKRNKKFKEYSDIGFGILAVSYRGYGDSEGEPTEEGLYNDARASLNFLINNGIKEKDVVVYGESLGTGVAVQIATEKAFRAVILEAPYDTIGARAAEIYPFFPVKLLLKDQYLSISKIGKIHSPILVIHSKDDIIMPIEHGIKLFNVANEPKEMLVFDKSGHSRFDYHKVAGLILKFISKKYNN